MSKNPLLTHQYLRTTRSVDAMRTKHMKVHHFSSFCSINWEHGPEYAMLCRMHSKPPSYILISHVSCETNK